jgi:hypothetical protein
MDLLLLLNVDVWFVFDRDCEMSVKTVLRVPQAVPVEASFEEDQWEKRSRASEHLTRHWIPLHSPGLKWMRRQSSAWITDIPIAGRVYRPVSALPNHRAKPDIG